MVTFDLPPKPTIWTPPKPAIIRAMSLKDSAPGLAMPFMTTFGAASLRKFAATPQVVAISMTDHFVSNDSINGTSVTYSAKNIGAVASDRKIAVGIFGVNHNNTLSSLTIGGITATPMAQGTFAGPASSDVALWWANVPAGTTADIVPTWAASSGNPRQGITVFRITGAASAIYASFTAGNSNPNSNTITIPKNGGCIGVAGMTSGGSSFTWAGLTESVDENVHSVTYHTSAFLAPATLQSGLTVSATGAGISGLAVASFDHA